jgi:aspartate/methionine/tyrosine aminotransferase
MKNLSQAAHNIQGQPMFKVLARVQELERQGKNIIHFEIGDPDFVTPKNIIESACDSLHRGETHYTSSMGLYDFREAVCDTTEISRGFRPDIEQVLITPGANIIIYYAIRCLVNPGYDVVLPDPYFPTYRSVINFCGVNPVYIPLHEKNGFRLNPNDIRKRITDKTRLIIINSPHNPCGSVMTPQELDETYNIAKEYDVFLLSDEVYSRMIYNHSSRFYSPSCRDMAKERTIVLNGFSKAFAMTGWRLGCVIGPEKVIEKMGLLLQTISSCVSPFIQRGGIEAIRGPQSEVNAMIEAYRQRRDILVKGLNELPGVSCLNPGGAFYVFPNIQGTGMDEVEFTRIMLEEAGVALLPGTNFGKAGAGYVRLCYATNIDNIREGLSRMNKCLKKREVLCV